MRAGRFHSNIALTLLLLWIQGPPSRGRLMSENGVHDERVASDIFQPPCCARSMSRRTDGFRHSGRRNTGRENQTDRVSRESPEYPGWRSAQAAILAPGRYYRDWGWTGLSCANFRRTTATHK